MRNSWGARAREEVERERCTREIAREGDARAIERGARTRVNEPRLTAVRSIERTIDSSTRAQVVLLVLQDAGRETRRRGAQE